MPHPLKAVYSEAMVIDKQGYPFFVTLGRGK